jgi:hypothetical protein
MESDPHLNSSAALETTLYALTQWAKPSRMGLAYRRFLHGVEQHSDTAGAALPALWEKPYRDLLVEVRDTVTHPFTHKVAISDRVRNALDIVGLLESYYGPANDLHLKEDHRFNLEWTYRDSSDIAVTEVASKATGKLHVVNVLTPMPPPSSPLGSFVGGTANAGVGCLFRPRHAMTKIKVSVEAAYSYNYLIYHDSPDTLSVATTRGFVRVLAFRVNVFNKTAELVAEWDKRLWEAENRPIVSRNEDQQSGTLNGSSVELDFKASSDFAYAVCCVASVYVNRGYYGGTVGKPREPTFCSGNLECDVAAIWLEQEKLA